MYIIFFAAFVLMALAVVGSTESGGTNRLNAEQDAAVIGPVKPATRGEYFLVTLMLVSVGFVALVGLYMWRG